MMHPVNNSGVNPRIQNYNFWGVCNFEQEWETPKTETFFQKKCLEKKVDLRVRKSFQKMLPHIPTCLACIRSEQNQKKNKFLLSEKWNFKILQWFFPFIHFLLLIYHPEFVAKPGNEMFPKTV